MNFTIRTGKDKQKAQYRVWMTFVQGFNFYKKSEKPPNWKIFLLQNPKTSTHILRHGDDENMEPSKRNLCIDNSSDSQPDSLFLAH